MSERIQPADFYSETPPPRIIGSECEYKIQTGPLADEDSLWGVLMNYIGPEAMYEAGYKHVNSFMDNGSRVYVDVGHLEYATPECLGPRQAAAADMAGISVMRNIVNASGQDHRGLYRVAGTNIDNHQAYLPTGGHTNGYHENYMVASEVAMSSMLREIMPTFLASRIWAMSGTLNHFSYALSQKVNGIGGDPVEYDLGRRTDTGNKPMIMIPIAEYDADVIQDKEWRRMEVRFADPCMSPTARYLGFAATSLMLRIIEQYPLLPAASLKRMTLEDPLEAALVYANDINFMSTSKTVYDADVTALDIQEQYADLASYLSERIELPADEVRAIPLWHEVIDKMRASNFQRHEFQGLELTLDIAAKLRFIASRTKMIKRTDAEAQRSNLLWDRIDPTGAGQIWWSKAPQQYVSTDEVNHLMHWAPAETRAQKRAEFITSSKRKLAAVSWNSYLRRGEDWAYFDFDPYGHGK